MDSIWVLLLDSSGSMGNPFHGAGSFDGPFETSHAKTKIDAAKDVLLKQLRGLTDTDVIVVTFTDSPQTIFRGSANTTSLSSSLLRVRADGGTDIAAAIRHATNEIPSKVIASILIITDGLSDYDPAVAAAQAAFARGIRLSGILIDPTPAGEALLRAISIGGDVKAVGSAQSLDRAVSDARDDMRREPPPAMAVRHQEAALPLHMTIVVLFAILALCCIGGGIYAVYRNAHSPTDLSFLGSHFSTGHVGVAFIGIGLLVVYFSVRSVLRNQRELAALPPDESHSLKRKKTRKISAQEAPTPLAHPNKNQSMQTDDSKLIKTFKQTVEEHAVWVVIGAFVGGVAAGIVPMSSIYSSRIESEKSRYEAIIENQKKEYESQLRELRIKVKELESRASTKPSNISLAETKILPLDNTR